MINPLAYEDSDGVVSEQRIQIENHEEEETEHEVLSFLYQIRSWLNLNFKV